MLENKRAETLRLLRESGENVSGQDLCEHFGISRTAVWKIMNQLKEEGYEIEAVQNKGYRLLNEPDLMTKDELESRTHTKYVGQTVYYSHEVDSTNTWAKRLAEEGAPNGTLTTAETQTAGKGRRGRVWKSPEGTSVSMSLLLYPDLEPAKAPMLTIVMGLAVVQGVQRALGVDTRIKWPNDAELEGKIYIAYCPERVLPGNVIYELMQNDRVIGGINSESTEKAIQFYRHFVRGTLHRTNARTAEMCKLTENSSRDVQIAFANELSLICDKAGINVWELIELANKHPRVNILQPGSGVGGHCIAVDPYFLTSEFPYESQLISKAREINNYKAFWCAEKIENAILRFFLEHHRKPVVALMGLSFKPDIDDLRESPAKYITSKVLQRSADTDILIVEPNVHEHPVFKLTDYKSAYTRADIVAFLVSHKEFKTLPHNEEKVILDFCGVFKKL